MKIVGFIIIRNAIINDYPVVEAITSILPVVDEMIVLVGNSDDATWQLIENINNPKIQMHHSVWDDTLRSGGQILAVETNKAFKLINPSATWAFYIQADEVVHEKYHASIKAACQQYANDNRVEGLLFKYQHFYGTYEYVGDSRKWYQHEVRIIRNIPEIASYKDAQGFRINERKLKVKKIDAEVYHYGWVKTPQQMDRKIKQVTKFWNEDSEAFLNFVHSEDFFNYNDFDSLAIFKGTHPQVMQQRIALHGFTQKFDIRKKNLSFKDKCLYFFEKIFGYRPFDFKNYSIIKS